MEGERSAHLQENKPQRYAPAPDGDGAYARIMPYRDKTGKSLVLPNTPVFAYQTEGHPKSAVGKATDNTTASIGISGEHIRDHMESVETGHYFLGITNSDVGDSELVSICINGFAVIDIANVRDEIRTPGAKLFYSPMVNEYSHESTDGFVRVGIVVTSSHRHHQYLSVLVSH